MAKVRDREYVEELRRIGLDRLLDWLAGLRDDDPATIRAQLVAASDAISASSTDREAEAALTTADTAGEKRTSTDEVADEVVIVVGVR